MSPTLIWPNVESAVRIADDGWQAESAREFDAALATSWGSRVIRADPRAQELRDLLDQDCVADRQRVKRPSARPVAQHVLRAHQPHEASGHRIASQRRKPETFEVDFTAEQQAVHDLLLDLAGRISTAKGHGRSLDFVLVHSPASGGELPQWSGALRGGPAPAEAQRRGVERGRRRSRRARYLRPGRVR